jgi:hypothetical protein
MGKRPRRAHGTGSLSYNARQGYLLTACSDCNLGKGDLAVPMPPPPAE